MPVCSGMVRCPLGRFGKFLDRFIGPGGSHGKAEDDIRVLEERVSMTLSMKLEREALQKIEEADREGNSLKRLRAEEQLRKAREASPSEIDWLRAMGMR